MLVCDGRVIRIIGHNDETGRVTIEALDNGDRWDVSYHVYDGMPESERIRYVSDYPANPFETDPVQDTEE